MIKIPLNFLLLFAIVLPPIVQAQNVQVDIDLEKQRFLGTESNLDRAKFFNAHTFDEDDDFLTFFKDNNAGFGRRFFGPFADTRFVRTKGDFPTTPATSDGIPRPVRRFVSTANVGVWSPEFDPNLAVNAAKRYWVDVVDTNNRPEYWEPFNEPFIKANRFESSSGLSNGEIVTRMSEWFRDMARGIHETPELANMKVIGFSSAFPSYARRDFQETWQNGMKKFIDIAGTDIDAISIHPYDGVNQTGQSNGRSGSNSEAILDLVETYTAQRPHGLKKLAITEYGVIEENDVFPPTDEIGPSFYNEARNALTIAGLNNMMFNFFERQDNIEIVIPFITGRADFFYRSGFSEDGGTGNPIPYTPAIVRPTELLRVFPFRNSEYVLTFKQNFYKFWKNIKGERAKITSNNLDVQVQAFVDGNTAYIALNNLDTVSKNVNLNFFNSSSNVTSVIESSLIINGKNIPIYNSEDEATPTTSLPSSTTLAIGETKIFKITYSQPLVFTSSITRTKYYATAIGAPTNKAPTIPVVGGQARTFTLSNVVKATSGDATLRISVGIPLESGLKPGEGTPTGLDRLPSSVTFNTIPLTIPANWKGNDQSNRVDFYGMFELNVPYDLLNNGDNEVTVTYTKTGGRIAAVVLSLENNDVACTPETFYADEDNDGLGDPNVTIQSCDTIRGFVSNSDDPCANDALNTCNPISIPGTIEAENFIFNDGTSINGTVISSINNGDSTSYNTNVTIPGNLDVTIKASAIGAGGTVTIFRGSDNLGTIDITNTGDINTFQDFNSRITIDQSGFSRLRFEYSGTGTADLFTIDSIEFVTAEEVIRFSDPNIEEIIMTIPNNATSLTLQLNYSTDMPGQLAGIEIRKPLVPGQREEFFKNRLIEEPTPTAKSNVDFVINFDPMNDLPIPLGDYRVLSFIITRGPTRAEDIFSGGDNVRRFIRVIEPTLIATNDQSLDNARGSDINVNILENDIKEDGTTPLTNEVTVDIDQNTTGVQNTLTVTNEGEWNYDTSTGVLSFTPNAGFTNNPTVLTYTLTENSVSANATVTFTYVQPPVTENDEDLNNSPGPVTINILSNDTTSSGNALSATDVTIDLNPSTTAIETTLSAGILGDWSYSNGILTFTPASEFSSNPPAISYSLTEISTSLSNTAMVTVTYRELSLAGFAVRNIGETCATENNGMIEIKADNSGDYSVEVSGQATIAAKDFALNETISGLDAGDYSIEITDKESQEKFTFNLSISEPENLIASTKVLRSSKQVTLDLAGSDVFTITLNGQEFTTTENNLTLSLENGENNLVVQAEKECQGKFSQKIIIGSSIKAYPNPVIDNLTIETGATKAVNINVFTIAGKLIHSQSYNPSNGTAQIAMTDFASGIYFILVETPNSTSTFKIIK